MNNKIKVPDLLLEKLIAGELDAYRKSSVLERLEDETGGMERLESIRESNRELLETYPARQMAANILERAEAGNIKKSQLPSFKIARFKSILALGIPAALAMALFFIVGPATQIQNVNNHLSQNSQLSGQTGDGIRLKGEPMLRLYKKTDRDPSLLENRAIVSAGDQLQIKYVPHGALYGIIFSVDGNGVITLHFPSSNGGTTRLENHPAMLDFAYTLDDAPKFERFYFVTSEKPVNVASVLKQAKKVTEKKSELSLPADLNIKEFTLVKDNGNESGP